MSSLLGMRAVSFSCTLLASIVITFALPRALGVSLYGEVGYITSVANFIIQILMLGSASSIPYFIVTRGKTAYFSQYFLYFTFVIFFAVLLTVSLFFYDVTRLFIWSQNADLGLICLGVLAASFVFFEQRCIDLADCLQSSELVDSLRVITKFMCIIFIFTAYKFGFLNPHSYFLVIVTLSGILLISYLKISPTNFEQGLIREFWPEFWQYNKPFIATVFFASFYTFAPRYLLQNDMVDGSSEQAYYTFSFAVSAIFIAIAQAYAMIFVSNSARRVIDEGGKSELRRMYKGVVISLLILLPFNLLAVQFLEEIVTLVGGEEFLPASAPLFWLLGFALLHLLGVQVIGFFNSQGFVSELNRVNLSVFVTFICFYIFIGHSYGDLINAVFVATSVFFGYFLRLLFLIGFLGKISGGKITVIFMLFLLGYLVILMGWHKFIDLSHMLPLKTIFEAVSMR